MVEHIVEMPKYVIFDGKWSIHVDLGRHNVRIDHACMIVARGAPLKFRPPTVLHMPPTSRRRRPNPTITTALAAAHHCGKHRQL